MFYCEMCGKETSKVYKVEVEGTVMELCKSCSRFGKVKSEFSIHKKEKRKEVVHREGWREGFDKEIEIVPNYGELIKKAREKLGLSQEELAKKLNIKHSVLHKIESQHMIPNENYAKKLEKFLGIKLIMEPGSNDSFGEYYKNKEKKVLTLGDVIEIKLKRGEKNE